MYGDVPPELIFVFLNNMSKRLSRLMMPRSRGREPSSSSTSSRIIDARSAAKKSAQEGVRDIFESFFGTESEADKPKQRKSHRVRATTVFTKFGGDVTSTEAEAAAKEIEEAEEARAAAAAEQRQARANTKEQKLAQDIEDAGKLYERMEAVGFDIQQFKDGQQPAILTLRPMTIVLVHKMGFEDDKKLNGKKREEILHLFQERVKRLYDAIPRPRRSLRNRA